MAPEHHPDLTHEHPTISVPDLAEVAYESELTWSAERPETLVVCCSDGRLQRSIDYFLDEHLGVFYYDRLYAPGGPGALSDKGSQFMRADHYRRDLKFLLDAHSFEQVILIFHGAAEDGPAHSDCAHYKTMMPDKPRQEIVARQKEDFEDVLLYLKGLRNSLDVRGYRAEATSEKHLRFVKI